MTQDAIETLHIKLRRSKWFEYARRRFSLVSLDAIADWCARPPGQVIPDPGRRVAILDALNASIQLGEFGDEDWPALAYLPKNVPADRIGSFPLRLSRGQIGHLHAIRHVPVADLWAPAGLCAHWLESRGVSLPSWLPAREAMPAEETQPASLPPFDSYQAQAVLIGMKTGGTINRRPSREEARILLSHQFSGVSRDDAEKIVKNIWKEGIRGPRKSAK